MYRKKSDWICFNFFGHCGVASMMPSLKRLVHNIFGAKQRADLLIPRRCGKAKVAQILQALCIEEFIGDGNDGRIHSLQSLWWRLHFVCRRKQDVLLVG